MDRDRSTLLYRLRHPYTKAQNIRLTMLDAAAEVERLESENKRLKAALAEVGWAVDSLPPGPHRS